MRHPRMRLNLAPRRKAEDAVAAVGEAVPVPPKAAGGASGDLRTSQAQGAPCRA
ncbi:MAG: hypothetical protein MZV49_10160 [Rhodopseudomonas palustris]|nr:hypothetical protein [Rhodopseudomonas palustris]